MEKKEDRICGNQDTTTLHWLAFAFMAMDHVGSVLFPNLLVLRMIGRLAFPLFAWCLVVGSVYTHDLCGYALRLAGMCVLSQPFYVLVLNHAWIKPNIFMTLLLGLIAIWGIRDRRPWIALIALGCAAYFRADYGYRGVLCILLLYACRENPYGLAIAFGSYCVFWGASDSFFAWAPLRALPLQSMAVLALPFLLWPAVRKHSSPKWFYFLYPAHLLVIGIIRFLYLAIKSR